MTANIDIFEYRSLTTAINKIKSPEPFLLDKIFKTKQSHVADKIDIEIMEGSAKLAAFANQNEGAHLVNKGTRTVKTISLPRTYEKKVFNASELQSFKPLGDIYAGSAAERAQGANEMVLTELDELKARALRRREQMAAEALSTGAISVDQENINFSVDYEFVNTKQLITLSGAAKWDAGTAPDIGKQMKGYKRDIMRACGVSPNIAILGSSAADLFVSNAEIKKQLDNLNYKIGALDLTGEAGTAAIFLGRLYGIDFYEYNQQYLNSSGVATDMIAATKCILIAQSSAFRLHYGPMYRIENGNLKVYTSEMLVESKTNDDKTILEWKAEQKSLPTIHDPGAVISLTVA